MARNMLVSTPENSLRQKPNKPQTQSFVQASASTPTSGLSSTVPKASKASSESLKTHRSGDGKTVEKGRRPQRQRRKSVKLNHGDNYFRKQIREQTSMIILGYFSRLKCTPKKLWKYDFLLEVDGEAQKFNKTDLACYYKQRDTMQVEAAMQLDESVASQRLEPIIARKERYHVDDSILETSERRKQSITVVLRTGHVIDGYIAWFSPYDIALMLDCGVKVQVFRHAIYDVKVEVGGAEPTNEAVEGETQLPPESLRSAPVKQGETIGQPRRDAVDLSPETSKIDINTASFEELVALEEISEAAANRIIKRRPHETVDVLRKIKGIGPAKLEKIRDRVTVTP